MWLAKLQANYHGAVFLNHVCQLWLACTLSATLVHICVRMYLPLRASTIIVC